MRIGRVMGVDIYLNVFFLALLGLFFVAGVTGKGLIAFAVVVLHELAHISVARRLDIPVTELELLPFGGVSQMGGDLVLNPLKEVRVSIAGPASNLILFALGVALKSYGIWDEELGPFFLQYNLLVAAFNMLPALPLDGGRVYRAYLAGRIGIREATYRAAGLGQAWAVFIVFLGSAGLAFGLTGLDIILTGLFLFYAATRERGMAPYLFMRHLVNKKSELLRKGILSAQPLVVLDDARLGEIIRPFLPDKFHLILVLDRHWHYKGVVTEAQVVDGLFTHGVDFPVGKLPLHPQ